MWGIDKEVWNYILVGIVSFLGSMLGIGSGNMKLRGTGGQKVISWLVAVGSSMLFAFVSYAVLSEFMPGSPKTCIALSGAVAWFGADWVRAKINSFLSKKIKNLKDIDFEGSEYEDKDK